MGIKCNNTITIICPKCGKHEYEPATDQQMDQLQANVGPGQTTACPECGTQATWTLGIASITPKCDHCGYNSHPIHARQVHTHLGMTCPQCGKVMISEHDEDTVETLLHLLPIINRR